MVCVWLLLFLHFGIGRPGKLRSVAVARSVRALARCSDIGPYLLSGGWSGGTAGGRFSRERREGTGETRQSLLPGLRGGGAAVSGRCLAEMVCNRADGSNGFWRRHR